MADNNIIKMACSLLQVQNSLRVKFIDTNNNPTILLQKVLVSQGPGQNFSLQHQYNIKQTSNENKEKY